MKTNKPYALNEQGQRQNQEDSIFPGKGQASSDTHFFIVCDGMGGHQNGEVASQTVCDSFAASLKGIDPNDFDEALFAKALDSAYNELDKKETSAPERGGKMGTTLAFLHLNNREAFLAHIGDSRIYQLRTAGGQASVVYRTSDHSLVNDLLKAGVITPEEAENHPRKNVITRAMQPHPEKRSKADIYRTSDVRPGDYFFICSDGVLESVSDDKLLEIVSDNTDDAAKADTICRLCQSNSRDNFSAFLIPVTDHTGSSR